MNRRSQILRFRQKPLWKRILDRYKFKGHLLRARVPLVLLRVRLPEVARPARTSSSRNVSSYLLNLHFQLSWPQWLINAYAPGFAFERTTFHSAVIRDLKWLLRAPATINTSTAPQLNTIALPLSKASRGSHRIGPSSQRRDAPRIEAGGQIRNRDRIQEEGQRVEPHSVLPRAALANIDPITSRETSLLQVVRGVAQPSGRNTLTSGPFIETVVKNRLHNIFVNRDIFASHLVSFTRPTQKTERIPAGKLTPKTFEAGAVGPLLLGDTTPRALNVNVETTSVSRLPLDPQFIHRARTNADGNSSFEASRARLYSDPALMSFVNQPVANSVEQKQPEEQSRPPQPPATVQPAQPQLDIGRLSEEVYRHIQRKIRVERERRGL